MLLYLFTNAKATSLTEKLLAFRDRCALDRHIAHDRPVPVREDFDMT